MTVTADTLHRGAKYFMDTGRAESAQDAMTLLSSFGLAIEVGPELVASRDHQVALLTLVNCARRMLLGGIHVLAPPEAPLLADLVAAKTLKEAVVALGGIPVNAPETAWPTAIIGSVPKRARPFSFMAADLERLARGRHALAGPAAVGESLRRACAGGGGRDLCGRSLLYHAADHPMAGRRSSGVSLWRPAANWLLDDSTEPKISYLPSRLWVIGLGNLGQAYLWLFGALDYAKRGDVEFVLQDFDRLAESNDSTSLLSNLNLVGEMKARATSAWLERQGFRTFLEERRFGPFSRRAPHEPAVALCGVDNRLARSYLEQAGFEWVIETGLGAGPGAFKNFSLHTFPSSLKASELWANTENRAHTPLGEQPAYSADKHPSLDECGLAQLASRSIGVPFVGLLAAAFGVSEILRRLHGGSALELLSGNSAVLEDIEMSLTPSSVYAFGHTEAIMRRDESMACLS